MAEAAMTSHTGRLYMLAFALVVFFLSWAALAARPWATATPDPRLQALAAREARLRYEAKLVNRVVTARWTAYRVALRLRNAQIAAARARIAAARVAAQRQAADARAVATSAPVAAAGPAARVVTLPPLTITRTS
jgi:hypothetical protein